MRIKRLNESIDKARLKRELTQEVDMLMDKRIVNLKQYEYRLQEAIERLFPGKAWWEVTDCNIFMDLFENRDPYGTAARIVDSVKADLVESIDYHNEDPEYNDGWNTDELQELMETLDEISNLEYELKSCKRGYLTFCKDAKELGRYIIKLGKELTDHGYDVQYRAEEEDDED